MNPKVDQFLMQEQQWQEQTEILRTICLDCGLNEELKWGKPCYTYQGSNVVIIQGFKDYCALLFFKGVLLKDLHKILVKTGENTRVGRQVRFREVEDIIKLTPILEQYIFEAVDIEKSGAKVPEPFNADPELPNELKHKFEEMADLKSAFEALTAGRQRAYCFYFNQAKQSSTREARIVKCIPKIMAGKGYNEK
ncbi:YdeI family protein [Saccharicrinis sp. FJH54]|uniref:YdeI/OmpD-associated family protein n=1 Tax=Saccharicrinis sp. FJH54 TaxID=3344665 RepID=UPI0035D49C47